MQTKGDMITAGIAKVRQAFLTLVKAGAWLPICVTIARPFIEHQMMSAIAAVSGRDTGATLFGPADMQLSANTSVKTIEGHYTCHTKSVITKPQNVCVLRDIMCSAYTAGGNTKFFCTPEGGTVDLGPGGPLESPEKFGQVVRNAIESRLNFEDENADYASMLAFVSSYKEESRGARDQVMSISQRVLPWDVSASSDQKHFPGGDAGYTIYKLLYGLDMIHHGEDQRASPVTELHVAGVRQTTPCASLARTGATTRTPATSSSLSQDRATLDQMPFRVTAAGGEERVSH